MNKRTLQAWLVLCLLWLTTAESQIQSGDDHVGSDFLQPSVSAGFSVAPARSFQDISGTFSVNSATVNAAFPVFRTLDVTGVNSTAYFVLARGEFSSVSEDVSFLPSSHSIYKSRVGFTGGIATQHRHLYLLTLAGGFADDHNTIDSPQFRGMGSLLGKYQLDDSFAFIYGLSYSYTFDRGLLLPLLGAHCSLGNDLSLHMVLPFSFDLDYRESKELHFDFVIRANGDQIHVDESNYFSTQTLPVYIKLAQVQVGFIASFKLSNDIWLIGEAGVLRNRNFAIGTMDANLASSKIANSGYSTIILRYDLGNFESWSD
jgi:hypothetical protein